MSAPSPASADTVIDGCSIVSNPTPTHFTNCPRQDLSGASLNGFNLSFANFSGARFAECFSGSPPPLEVPPSCSVTDLTNANLTDADLTGIDVADAAGGKCGSFPCEASGSAFFNGANLSGANMSNSEYGAANFSDANLAGANLLNADFEDTNTSLGPMVVGANLTGANFTNTILVPSNQSVTATSQAGAVATWSTPPGIPGATPGSCTASPGSTFPLFSSTVTCQVLDANNNVATGTFRVNVLPTTQYFTRVLIPSVGAALAGAPYLDAGAADGPGAASVVFELSGGTLSNQVIATATPTLFGWLAKWNTTTVPNGSYSLQSVATDTAANTDTSTPITITVNNQPPTTAVIIPSGGTTMSGATALIDASASGPAGIASVTFEVSGGTLSDQVVATATPTIYGWLATWNTTTVPNGSYSLQSLATDTVAESAPSAPISVTVNNPPPTTAVVIPSNTATQSGTAALVDASASANVTSVSFELSGGTLTNLVISAGFPTIYGWLGQWNTTSVLNGTYALESVACYTGGVCGTSPGITITVGN
jgi:uncharacterized protein YjbI with pentapeptide repeats